MAGAPTLHSTTILIQKELETIVFTQDVAALSVVKSDLWVLLAPYLQSARREKQNKEDEAFLRHAQEQALANFVDWLFASGDSNSD